ncbi:MAG: rhodanese-like domain-containing protein [Saprospirales bacterium]|nr:MAG: rhodanese-like domain-containing protein [Saprospirales bacterium]
MFNLFKTKAEYSDIDSSEFTAKMNSRESVIIDVRTPAEFNSGHIPNAVNIDLTSPNFQNEMGRLDKSKSYLLYCRSGARSSVAAKLLARKGYENVYNLNRGLMGWNGVLEN